MNAEMMSNVVDVELIYEGVRYSLKVSRVQPTSKATPTCHNMQLEGVIYLRCPVVAWDRTFTNPNGTAYSD